MPKNLDQIIIKGARMHNLKNVDLILPRQKLIVFTGLSGSGKSSLAFDTIFAEGQRRYVESLSAYARQFIDQMPKPDVDEITGLSPAISIDQKTRSTNPRSTVATVTEIYDYLRVLYARIGRPQCLLCGRPIERLAPAEIVKLVERGIAAGSPALKATVTVYAPVVRGRKGEYYQLLYDLLSQGYQAVRIDGREFSLRERIVLEKNKKHQIDVMVDRLDPATGADFGLRLAEAVERAISLAAGVVRVVSGETESVWSTRFACPHDGFAYPEIEPRLFSFNSPAGACPACHGLGTRHFAGHEPCPECQGARLRPEALGVRLDGKNIAELGAFTIAGAADFFRQLNLTPAEREIARAAAKEIADRLQFLLDVGLNYLTLDRRANTLSGGESQRIRLASQLGSRLVGALYVLDEPTIGLHPSDTARLLATLKDLRDLGNTIIVVEHDEDTIFASDYLVDIGPGAGRHGGEIVASGPTTELITAKTSRARSSTLAYLRGEKVITVPARRRAADHGWLKIRGAEIFNLRNLNLDLPLGRLIALTGVSGSGKSTLLYEILHRNLRARFDRRYRSNEVFFCRSFTGAEFVNRSILIDQTPVGRTPRSNPATYTGAFSFIRQLLAVSEGARLKGWSASRFSFNVPAAAGRGGRCEACQGNGVVAVEMHFLPTVYVECEVCQGRRFEPETLAVKYQGKNVYEILRLTVEEALEFFGDHPAVNDRLRALQEVGLGYLELGQPATTLSGGEAQRLKIASELYRPETERTVYLLDEPTVGLHYEDVRQLIIILQRLVERGNTVVVIEHNLALIKNADYLVDLGPGGGPHGGQVVASGSPETVARSAGSPLVKYLRRTLK